VPELPEVETVRRSLLPALYDGTITGVEVSRFALRQRPIDRGALEALVGARFTEARRHGKYLMLDTSAGASLLVHLGMSGRLLLVEHAAPVAKHTHVTLTLSSGRALRYVDPRRFGIVRSYATASLFRTDELGELGPDPIAGRFDLAALTAGLETDRDLKAVLLDQKVVAGLGNIYVSEALWEARLSPKQRGRRLRAPQIRALHAAIGKVLRRAVNNRGTSLSDYVDATGQAGSNQNALRVYERAGEACRRCKIHTIRRIVQAGRSTYYCPGCQPR
jgi:formamidopyrimidine-DNA glycosylase